MAGQFAWSVYDEHRFDRTSVPQDRLDISGSRRVNALPWRGQFSPELAELLLGEFLPSGVVLDPFCGSGTTLSESAKLGRSSFGSEINPAAYLLARVYELGSLDVVERKGLLADLSNEVFELGFRGAGFQQVSEWAQSASGVPEKYLRDAVFLLAARNDSVINPGRLGKAAQQVSSLLEDLPDWGAKVTVALGDARSLEAGDGVASGLLTSPPYVNVFNYHQNYRPAVESLGWGVLSSAKAEFGSNRKHRQNRFLTVIQYAQDILESLRESARVLKPGATSVWVVGRESRVRGVAIPNPLIVFEAAVRGCGMTLVSKHERGFTSRYGQYVFEDILVFSHPVRSPNVSNESAADLGREIGVNVLTSVLSETGDITSEIEAAIEGSARVVPSERPIFAFPKTGIAPGSGVTLAS